MTVSVFNRQRSVAFDMEWVRCFAVGALEQAVKESGDGNFALRKLDEVEVTIVSDKTIARVHRDFMEIDGATDVITFEHGEIVLSADTARLQAGLHKHRLEEEIGLYIIHGLLHLNGFDDLTPPDFRKMHKVQNRIWERLRSWA